MAPRTHAKPIALWNHYQSKMNETHENGLFADMRFNYSLFDCDCPSRSASIDCPVIGQQFGYMLCDVSYDILGMLSCSYVNSKREEYVVEREREREREGGRKTEKR